MVSLTLLVFLASTFGAVCHGTVSPDVTNMLVYPHDTSFNVDSVVHVSGTGASKNKNKHHHKPSAKPSMGKPMKIKSVGFSGSGFYFSYHLGVLSVLQQKKLVKMGKTPFWGTSGGSIVTAGACAGVSVETMMAANLNFATYCNASATLCAGELDGLLEKSFQENLPQGNAWKNCNNKGNIHISLSYSPTNAFPNCNLTGGNWTVSKYTSRQDLIDASLSSSFVVGASGFACNRQFRNTPVFDGGYSVNLPCDGMEDGSQIAKGCLGVAVVPKELWPGMGPYFAPLIYPGIRGSGTLPLPLNKWFSGILNAQIYAPIANTMFQLGVDDATWWVENGGGSA